MNPLWLLLIVPGAFFAGFCFNTLFENSDAERAKIIDRQYRELSSIIEDIWPKPHGLADLLSRHDREREELE